MKNLIVYFLFVSLCYASDSEILNNAHARFCIGQIDGFNGSSYYMLDTETGRLWHLDGEEGKLPVLKEIKRIDNPDVSRKLMDR